MPSKTLKINVYDIQLEHTGDEPETEFEDAIKNTCDLGLAERERFVGGKRRRINEYDERDGILFVNFVTFEYSGPGRVRRGQPTQAIALQADESFAPETAMLYDPESRLAFVESALGAMGPSSISDYLKEFANAGTGYSLIPRADNNAAVRARRHRIIRSLKMRVALGPVTAEDRAAGIGAIKGLGADFDAGIIDLEMKSERTRGRSLSVRPILEFISRLTGGDRLIPAVQQLQVTGKENDDDPLEVIDLIQHRERRQISLQIDATTRRIPCETRWDALARTRRGFI